jgi:hypothetical protein
MKNIAIKTTCRLRRVALVLAAFWLLLPGAGALAEVILPVDSQEETGKTYGEWSANWWQYVLSIPAADNPLLDETGENCALDQDPDSPVFFLVGALGGSITRDQCTVPAGKVLFFPLLNNLFVRTESHETEDLMRNRLTGGVKATTELHASIDGVPVDDLGALFRTVSPAFYITLPEGNLFGAPSGTNFAVADGHYLMVPPLSPGTHTINFGGTTGSFTVDVTYDPLTVEEGTE